MRTLDDFKNKVGVCMSAPAKITKVKFIEKDDKGIGHQPYLRIWFKGPDLSITYDWDCCNPDEEEDVVKWFKKGDEYRIEFDGTHKVKENE